MPRFWSLDLYRRVYRFAAQAHHGQRYPGTELPYLMHLGFVSVEVMGALHHDTEERDADLAVACALLHDTLEDTDVIAADLRREFGDTIAEGVLALTKNDELPTKRERMNDSLRRIQQQPHEVWMVKLADRICNLDPPPSYWKQAKREAYRDEAQRIFDALHPASSTLAQRLQEKIATYPNYYLPS